MLRKGFFTSDSWTINGDGFAIGNNAEGSDFLAKMLALSVSNGIPYRPSSNLRVQATTGMILSVGAGLAMKNGYMAWETTNASITCTSSESEQTLYISHRFDLGNNEITGDSVDKYTTFDPVTDLCYAIVVIPANAVTITDAMIADVRSQAAYCGYITDQREYLETLISEIQHELTNVIGGGMPDHASTHAAAGDDPTVARFSIAVTATWTGAEAPYTQIVNVAGVTSGMVGKLDIVFDDEDDLEDQLAQRDAWRLVDDIAAGSGTVTLTCFEEAPETAFNLQMEVIL